MGEYPLVDGKPNQSTLLLEAIEQVAKGHDDGKKVVLHEKVARVALVAGVLLKLKIVDSVKATIKIVKDIRPEIELHPEFIQDLITLFPQE